MKSTGAIVAKTSQEISPNSVQRKGFTYGAKVPFLEGTAMSKLTNRQLQAAINKCAKGNAMAHDAQELIDQHCEVVFGASPSDADCDSIIDSVFGGCGRANGMTVEEFNQAMNDALNL